MENTQIIHTGMDQLLKVLNAALGGANESGFHSIQSNDELKNILNNKKYDLLLIGPEVSNPIQLLQTAAEYDDLISVLLIIDPSKIMDTKQQLAFTPFISNTFKVVVSNSLLKFVEEVKEGIKRTRQRRDYREFSISQQNKLN